MRIIQTADRDAAEETINALLSGQIVIFPTDTVYGLGCIPEEKSAKKIFKIKNRRPDKPLPLLVADFDQALSLAYFTETAEKAVVESWPGATTLILKARKELPSWVCREGKVALRIPDHPFLREVIRKTGQAIIGTSANLSGEKPAGRISELPEKLLAEADLVIDGGVTSGKPSVIYDFTGTEPVIIRV